MDITIDFNIFEVESLITFLEDCVNKNNLTNYSKNICQYLFLAYLKLKKEKEEWENGLKYSD